MIRNPKPGQRVRFHYAKARRAVCQLHGYEGVVVAASKGPGPRNVCVQVPGVGVVVCVPCGNLARVDK